MGPKAQTACLGNEKGRRVETGLHPGAGRLPHSLGRAIKTSRKAPLALLGASAFEELVARMRCDSDEAARGRDGMTVHPSAPEDVAPAIAAGVTEHNAQDPTLPEASPAPPAAGSADADPRATAVAPIDAPADPSQAQSSFVLASHACMHFVAPSQSVGAGLGAGGLGQAASMSGGSSGCGFNSHILLRPDGAGGGRQRSPSSRQHFGPSQLARRLWRSRRSALRWLLRPPGQHFEHARARPLLVLRSSAAGRQPRELLPEMQGHQQPGAAHLWKGAQQKA